MRKLALALIAAALLSPSAQAASVTLSGSINITINGAFGVTVTPPAPMVACELSPGSTVATLTATAGDGNAVTWATPAGDIADFVLSATSGPTVGLLVGPAGIAPANCGKTVSISWSATQP